VLKPVTIDINGIYVTASLKKEFDSGKAEKIAEEFLENNLSEPIQVRQGNGRFVLIKGVHRLEAMKALGESKIEAFIVSARQH
tara:strand:+ start:1024 stop:1272 length:249 start_codon:yes stop_codon:yes gene_type:complete